MIVRSQEYKVMVVWTLACGIDGIEESGVHLGGTSTCHVRQS